MNNKLKLNDMKTLKRNAKWLIVLGLALSVWACKKDEQSDIVEAIKKEELTRKIAEIIPQQYQDTIAKLGITLSHDVTPPNLEGAFAFRPMQLIKSNRPTDPAGMFFKDVQIKFFSQDKENNIKLISKFLLNDADTSIITAISGSGKDFTIYGKVKSVSGTNSAIFGVILAGQKDGNVIRNLRLGLVNIDNSNGGTRFIKQGEARAILDTDMISESIPMF